MHATTYGTLYGISICLKQMKDQLTIFVYLSIKLYMVGMNRIPLS